MIRAFTVACDEFSQRDFELIHIYIRKKLDPKNKNMKIRSKIITEGQYADLKRRLGLHE